MNDFVCSDALVMPRSTGTPTAGFFFSATSCSLISSSSIRSICSPVRSSESPALGDLDLLQHLANDHLDVLVVDVHALEPVDLLDLVDEIGGELLDALDRQDVVRRRVAVDDEVAELDLVAVLQVDVLALRDQVLDRVRTVMRLQRQAALVLVVAPELDRARLLGDDGRVLRTARLEQLRHARQTARDVARLGRVGRDAGEDVAGLDLRARIDARGSPRPAAGSGRRRRAAASAILPSSP